MDHNDEIIISLVELIERLADPQYTRLVKRFSPPSKGGRLSYLELSIEESVEGLSVEADTKLEEVDATQPVRKEPLCFPVAATLPPGYQEFKMGVDKWRRDKGQTQAKLAFELGTYSSKLSLLLKGGLPDTRSSRELRLKVEKVTGVKLIIKTKIKLSHVTFKVEMDKWVEENSTTYKTLAKKIGVSKTLLTDLVSGRGNPTKLRLRAMEHLQGITGVAFYK